MVGIESHDQLCSRSHRFRDDVERSSLQGQMACSSVQDLTAFLIWLAVVAIRSVVSARAECAYGWNEQKHNCAQYVS